VEKIKLLWLIPELIIKTRGILIPWAEWMERIGFEITDNADEADLIFFGSDSEVRPELLGKKPTICNFWGWIPERLLYQEYRQFAEERLMLMAQCNKVIAPSPTTRDQVLQFGIKCDICMPGVDIDILDQAPKQLREPKVIFISRLAPQKNLHILIQAISMLQPSVPLLVIGPGDTAPYQELASQLGVNVTFSEPTDYERAIELKKAAVLVHPSSYEGFGLPPLEALACGTPVIAADTPHMRWLLQEDAYFFTSIKELAQAIKNIFNNRPEAYSKAAHGEERVRNALTIEHAAGRLWLPIHDTIRHYLGEKIRQEPDRWSSWYDIEHRRNWSYSVERLSPEWFRHWRAQYVKSEVVGSRVLDIGAGAGTYTIMLAQDGHQVTWNDISEEALRQAKYFVDKFSVSERVTFCLGDCQKLPLDDNTFDSVWMGEILEHVPDPLGALKEALRVTRKGGKVIFSTPHDFAFDQIHYDPMHLHRWTKEEFEVKYLQPLSSDIAVEKLEIIGEEGGIGPSCLFGVLRKA